MNRYVPPRRSAFVAARPSGFVNPLDPFGLLTGGPFGPPIGPPSLTSAPAIEGWGSAPGEGYGSGPGPSTPTQTPASTRPTVDTRFPTSQQPATVPAPRNPAAQPSMVPMAAPPAADTGMSTLSMVLLGGLAVGGIAGAAYYFTKKGRR